MCFMGKWWRGWTDSRNVADMQICWRWNLVYYRRTVNILEIWITFWYYLLLFTKSMFQPYSILAQVLKVEYIAIRFWSYNIEDITLEWNLVSTMIQFFFFHVLKYIVQGFQDGFGYIFPPYLLDLKENCVWHIKNSASS